MSVLINELQNLKFSTRPLETSLYALQQKIEVLIKDPVRSIVIIKSFEGVSLLTETRGQSLLVGPHRPLDFPHVVHLSDPSANNLTQLEPSLGSTRKQSYLPGLRDAG